MEYKTKIKPSKESSIALIVIGSLFVIFGVVFFLSVLPDLSFGDGGVAIIAFFVLWILACIGLVIYGIINITKKEGITAYELNTVENTGVNNTEARLKNIENLRQKQLITEEEYQKKRKEIIENEL